ncbi:uncharacterized protein LOC126560768 [Anopheles maculipalpis]|uniref:uncharacterized protein LOC126560768 n=1 Tax=Anopheles maculipalpis TaxID=1496333 RepID=UPI00215949F2|nr:uncharacterized protein LOC126560768 [Anopheles maculipalpis]
MLVQLLLFTTLVRCIANSLAQNEYACERFNTSSDDGWDCGIVPAACLILTTVNYRVPEKEFAINFRCNLPPFRNAHSDEVFRKVTSYRMDGSNACSTFGFGLEYLSFPERINSLVLDGYCLQTIGNGTFQDFHTLGQLELTGCKIQHATSDGFHSLPVLQKLVIEQSVFLKMNRDVFDNFKQLKELTMDNCSVIHFTAGALESIERIVVKNSVVHNISSIFDHLPLMLKIIHFAGVHSQQSSNLVLRSSDAGESTVHNITVVQCELTSVAVKNMPLLVSLNFSKNSLSERSVELVNLPRLVSLVLNHNAFDAVSETFLKFGSSLEVIDLSYNQISYLHPHALDAALSLRLMNLSHNQLSTMQNTIPAARLARIDIDSNPWDCSWLNRCRLLNPTLFNIFRYNKRYDVLAVWGIPCLLQTTSTDPNFPPFQSEPNVSSTSEPVVSYPQGKLFLQGNKISITSPRFTVPNTLMVIISISVGVLVSNVIILLYNRYRKIMQQPFYRLLSKSVSARDTATEKSTSFWYEVPVCGESNALPLNHIYEEICDTEAQRDIYDALNFNRDKQQQLDSASSNSERNGSTKSALVHSSSGKNEARALMLQHETRQNVENYKRPRRQQALLFQDKKRPIEEFISSQKLEDVPEKLKLEFTVSSSGFKMPAGIIKAGLKVNTDIYLGILKEKFIPWIENNFDEHQLVIF